MSHAPVIRRSAWCAPGAVVFVFAWALAGPGAELRGEPGGTFHFTATADPRSQVTRWDEVLSAINSRVGGPGIFHITAGDLDPPQPIRDRIDARFGASTLWYPVVGNHEEETASDMAWIRGEYLTGNGVRTPLQSFTNRDGPLGSVETTYTFDYANAHFVVLNQYWNGQTAPGSDVATDGNTVPALYDWLAADLEANTRPAVFVIGHEPAFPFYRHIGDSLDQYPARRDAFWSLLESKRVQAFLCGHTHFYSRYQKTPGATWQIDLGNAGNESSPGDGQTFADITVSDNTVRYDIWRNATGSFVLAETWSEPIGAWLQVSPAQIERTVHLGDSLPPDSFTVTAVGAESLSYTITDDADWLTVQPDQGESSGEADMIEIMYDVAGLAVGRYGAQIAVLAEGDIGTQYVSVNVEVRTVSPDFDGDGDVDQADFGHFQVCRTSPGLPPLAPACANARLDGDPDVDNDDLAILQRCLSGANVRADPTCDD